MKDYKKQTISNIKKLQNVKPTVKASVKNRQNSRLKKKKKKKVDEKTLSSNMLCRLHLYELKSLLLRF